MALLGIRGSKAKIELLAGLMRRFFPGPLVGDVANLNAMERRSRDRHHAPASAAPHPVSGKSRRILNPSFQMQMQIQPHAQKVNFTSDYIGDLPFQELQSIPQLLFFKKLISCSKRVARSNIRN